MSNLVIDALEVVGYAARTPVRVDLTDSVGNPITGYIADTDSAIVSASVFQTDTSGHLVIDLVPTADIVPGNSCYTVTVGTRSFLIQKSGATQNLLESVVQEPGDLDPITSGVLLANNNLSDVEDAATSRDNLGLGDSATLDVGNTAGTVAAGDDPRFGTGGTTDHTLLTNRDAADQHPADAITVTPAGTIASTNAQDALEELDSDLTAHVADATDAHAASAIGFTPTGTIAATDVQAAVAEVATDAIAREANYVPVDGSYAATTTDVLKSRVTGDAAARFTLNADGLLEWGAGAVAPTLSAGYSFGTLVLTSASSVGLRTSGQIQANSGFVVGNGLAQWRVGSTSPEGSITAPIGSIYSRTTAGAGLTFYLKESGAGNTGWVAIGDSLAAHIANATGAHAASAISFTPTGTISSTNTQAAIAELGTEKAELNDPRIVRSDAALTDQGELIGFPNRTDATMALVNAGATYTVTLTPVSSSFSVWAAATKYTKSSVESISMPKTSGLRYVYYNSSGVLTQSTTKWNWNTDAPVAVYYYSVAAGAAFLIDERHGVNMDNDTQQWLSETAGSRITSGIALGSYTLSPSSPVDADNKFSTTAGTIVDADITYTIPAVAAGGGAGLYGIFYRSGTTEWTIAGSTVPVVVGTTYPKWNQNVAGTWQLTEASNGDYMNMWLLAVPTPMNGLRSYILVPGEAVHPTLADAMSESDVSSPLLASFPFREAISHYRITIQCGNAYGTTGKFRIRDVTQLIGRSITTVTSTLTEDHAVLANRSIADQHPASSITFTPYDGITSTNVQSAMQELADERVNVDGSYAATTTPVYKARVTADANPRLIQYADGKVEMGDGIASTLDTNFYRRTTDTLKTDDTFEVGSSGVVVAPTGRVAIAGGSSAPSSAMLSVGTNASPNRFNSSSAVTGIVTNPSNLGTGPVVGVSGQAQTASTSTVSALTGVLGAVTSATTSTITAGYALKADPPTLSGSGTIATAVGLQIEAQKITGVTTAYGVRQLGTNDLNSFAGVTSFGQGVTVTGTLTNTELQAATSNLATHLANPTGAHAASAISHSAVTHMSTTNMQTALAALPKGILGYYAGNPGSSSAHAYATTNLLTGVTLTLAVSNTRYYLFSFSGPVFLSLGSGTAANWHLDLVDTSLAPAIISKFGNLDNTSGPFSYSSTLDILYKPTVSGTITFGVQLTFFSGAGATWNENTAATGTNTKFWVQDMGPQ